jgi:hypothetical protein
VKRKWINIQKRETRNKNCHKYERSFTCYETDTESDEIFITSFSITCWTEQHWHSLPYCRTLQLCKYSSCYIRPQSSLYTHSSSYDGRQCGDYRYCILWWIKFGAFTFNIMYWSRSKCGSLRICCSWLLECLVFVCPFSLYMCVYTHTHTHTQSYLYIWVCVYMYVCIYIYIYIYIYSYNIKYR